MTVSQILKVKGLDVVTGEAGETLAAATRKLEDHGIGAVVIVDKDRRVQGILSERDIVRSIARKGAVVLDQPVSQHMTKDVVTCAEGERVDDVMQKMTEGKFRHLPVVDGDRLVGIISIGDVVKHKIWLAEQESESLREYIAHT